MWNAEEVSSEGSSWAKQQCFEAQEVFAVLRGTLAVLTNDCQCCANQEKALQLYTFQTSDNET